MAKSETSISPRCQSSQGKGLLLYGGSFNPLHIAHLRAALECSEKMADLADRLDFLPAGSPPHKKISDLLPFDLRAEMTHAAIKHLTNFGCNEIEKQCSGLSYTFEILKKISQTGNIKPLFFIIGSQDYALLSGWNRGLRLPELCSLVVVPRGGHTKADFLHISQALWPGLNMEMTKCEDSCMGEQRLCLRHPAGNSIYWLEIPQQEISASRIRRLWLCGRNVDFLLPEPVINILKREERLVRRCWEGECSR